MSPRQNPAGRWGSGSDGQERCRVLGLGRGGRCARDGLMNAIWPQCFWAGGFPCQFWGIYFLRCGHDALECILQHRWRFGLWLLNQCCLNVVRNPGGPLFEALSSGNSIPYTENHPGAYGILGKRKTPILQYEPKTAIFMWSM